MTIANENKRNDYNGNDVAVAFAVTFCFFATGDVKAVLYNDVTEVETILTETTHYSLTGAGVASGGTLTMVTAPTSDETLTILRNVAALQETNYVDKSTFPAESHETALDRLTTLVQKIDEKLIRAILFRQSAEGNNVEIEDLVAERTLIINALGDKIIMGTGETVDTALVVLKSMFDAHTIIMASIDNVPEALTIAASRIIGRASSGNITALTPAQIRTIINVEDNADVTDAINVASSVHGVSAKGTPVNADEMGLIDSAASWALKKVTWTNIKVFLKAYFDTLYAALGVNADITSMTGLDNDGIPLVKVANAAANGVNADITSMTGLDDGGIPAIKIASGFRSLDVRDFIHDDGSGTNNVISTMAFIPKFKTAGWPQTALNGLDVGGFWIDVYKNSHPAATSTARGTAAPDTPGAMAATSRPGVSVWDDISWISARIAASNRTINGRSCHLVTPFERFAVLSWVMASGNWGNIRGNNNNGKDTRDADSWENYGIFDPLQAAYRILSGSGSASWWSGGVIGQGIHGLVGNVYEWEDLRLEAGIFQPKAYLAGATTAADTYIDYDDNASGDGADVCQLTPGVYTITDATNGNEDVTVEQVIITGRFTGRLLLAAGMSTNHIDNALIQLKTAVNLCQDDAGAYKAIGKLLEDSTAKYMAMPDHADISTHASTYLDSWYAFDDGSSRALRRCGNWSHTTMARSGLFIITHTLPTSVDYNASFRAALSIGNQ